MEKEEKILRFLIHIKKSFYLEYIDLLKQFLLILSHILRREAFL